MVDDTQALSFGDASFDTVGSTLVFCSVPDPIAGLEEARRVLVPGGRLLLLEVVRAIAARAPCSGSSPGPGQPG
jgi:ubiquinone/menaquinone biosynthesis C-methylase UbiE